MRWHRVPGCLRACVRQVADERLHVWRIKGGITLPHGGRLSEIVARLDGVACLPDTGCHEMVLEVPTYARQMLDDWNPEAFQLGFITDTGLHEQLRCMDRSQRQ